MRLLKVTRAVFGIRQQELARAANVSVRELARIEACQVQPSLSVLAALDTAILSLIHQRVSVARATV